MKHQIFITLDVETPNIDAFLICLGAMLHKPLLDGTGVIKEVHLEATHTVNLEPKLSFYTQKRENET